MVKAAAHRAWITEIRQTGEEIRITFFERAKLDPAVFPALMAAEQYRNCLFFHMGKPPYLVYKPKGADRKPETVLKKLKDLCGKLTEPVEKQE